MYKEGLYFHECMEIWPFLIHFQTFPNAGNLTFSCSECYMRAEKRESLVQFIIIHREPGDEARAIVHLLSGTTNFMIKFYFTYLHCMLLQ